MGCYKKSLDEDRHNWSRMGKENVIAKEPYVQSVKERAQIVNISFFFESSSFPPVLEPEPILRKDVEKFQLGRACTQIKNLKNEIYDQAYQELKKNYRYWEEKCLRGEDDMAQMDGIIKNLQTLYTDWKNKYANMVVLTNFSLQDFPEKLKEADMIMYPKNTPKRSLTS